MNTTELILLITGALVFTISFLLPAGKKEKREEDAGVRVPEEEIREKIEGEVQEARKKIEDVVDETVRYSMEKTERAMEKTSNEKIMAINEFSDTVLAQIGKNHKEAVFLYDMLNDKHDKLKSTVSEAMTVEGKLKDDLEKASFAPIQAERITVLPDFTAEEENRAVVLAATGLSGTAGEVPADTRAGQAEVSGAAELSGAYGSSAETEKGASDADSTEAAETSGMTGSTKESTAGEKDGSGAGAKASSGKRRSASRTKTAQQKPMTETDAGDTRKAPGQEAGKSAGAAQSGKEPARQVDVSMAAAGRNGSRNNNEKIRELHKAGKSNMAIAKELGLGIGEVKLVLDLFADT